MGTTDRPEGHDLEIAPALPAGAPIDDVVDRREFLALCGRGATLAAAAGFVGCATPARAQEGPAQEGPGGPFRYPIRDYGALRGLARLPDAQVEVHLALYAGYVRRTNALLDAFAGARGASDAGAQELRRRLGFEWNGMRLHELYFDGLAPDPAPLAPDGAFARAVAASYGGVDAWRRDLLATASMPGVGWAITVLDGGRVLNTWVNDHEAGALAGARPLLVVDVWEHAFAAYRKPTERAAYLDDLLACVDWHVVEARFAG